MLRVNDNINCIRSFIVILLINLFKSVFAQNEYALPDSCVANNLNEEKKEIDDDDNGFIDDLNGIYLKENETLMPHYTVWNMKIAKP